MSRCPYLEYNDSNIFGFGGTYKCSIANTEPTDQEIKNKCNSDYGNDEYEKCPTYKNR